MDVFDKYIVMGKTKRKKSVTPIQKLLKKPLVSSKDFRENGYPPDLLRYYEKKGIIKRVERGFYLNNQIKANVLIFFRCSYHTSRCCFSTLTKTMNQYYG